MVDVQKKNLGKTVKEALRKIDIHLSISFTVDEAIQYIRKTHDSDTSIFYHYVVSDSGKLLGTVKTRQLLTSASDTPLRKIIDTKVKTLQAHHTLYEGLMLIRKFRLLALPVVEGGILLGVLDIQTYFDESIELDSAKKRQEIFQTLGIVLDEGPRQTTWNKYRSRMPWIFCNMVGGFACAIISDFYEIVLLKVIVLAMFIPLVLSLSESISMQAMTQAMYHIEKKRRPFRSSLSYILHESKLFVLIALTSGVVVGGLSLLWGDGWGPGMIITISIMVSIVVTAIIGAFVPLVLHSWKLDPKIASGPIVLMFADVITTSIYLSLGFFLLIGN